MILRRLKTLPLLLLPVLVLPLDCSASSGFVSGNNNECYVDRPGVDEYWFCGQHAMDCRGIKVAKSNPVYWKYHGEKFNWTMHGGLGNYWCCQGTRSQTGWFVQSSSWIKETKTETKTVRDSLGNPVGKCTWVQKINVCGDVDNPDDECMEANPMIDGCADGYMTRNNKCVKACSDGYAFETETSSNCIPCEVTSSQGVVKSNCVKCESNEFFDKTALKCIKNADRLQVSSIAHEECWMCVTPTALHDCMKLISNGGRLSDDLTLKSQCSLGSKAN